ESNRAAICVNRLRDIPIWPSFSNLSFMLFSSVFLTTAETDVACLKHLQKETLVCWPAGPHGPTRLIALSDLARRHLQDQTDAPGSLERKARLGAKISYLVNFRLQDVP